MINFNSLPKPTVLEQIDFETRLAEHKARLIALRPETAEVLALESEPLTITLEWLVYLEILLRQRINEAASATMLPFARGADLDNVLARFDTPRLIVRPADNSTVPPTPAVMESDDDYLARGQQAFDRLAAAGPRAAYIAHALYADGRIADASAISPAPCEVVISVLAREGDGTASAELLAKVTAALSDEDVRPLGDRLTVQSAGIVPYQVQAVLHCYPGPESEPIYQAATAKLANYISTQRRLGRDIRRSALYAALHVEGVQRVELIAPAVDLVLSPTQAAYCTANQISLGAADE